MNLDKKSLKILKRIYHIPYITMAEMKQIFPDRDTEEILVWLEKEHYISFRIAGSADEDEGYEGFSYNDDVHLLCLRKGNIASEDMTLFRANAALVISLIALLVSIIALFIR